MDHKEQLLQQPEKESKIEIEIFLISHVGHFDVDGLKNKFKQADIYVPEQLILTDPRLLETVLNEVSLGKKSPEEALSEFGVTDEGSFYYFTKAQFDMIFNSGKKIWIVEDILSRRNEEIFNKMSESSAKYKSALSVEEAVSAIKEYFVARGEFERKREEFISKKIKERTEQLQNSGQETSQTDKIKILLTLGAMHTGAGHILEREFNDVKNLFSFDMPIRFGLGIEALRRTRFGLEINDKLAKRALIEEYLTRYIGNKIIKNPKNIGDLNYEKIISFLVKIVDGFDEDEVTDILKQIYDENKNYNTVIASVLDRKGIVIPAEDFVHKGN